MTGPEQVSVNVADEDAPTCVRCNKRLTPDDMVLTCPCVSGRRRTHEVLNPPTWQAGDPVRSGHSIHVKGCERAMEPSVYADPPCTCRSIGEGLIRDD